MGFKYQLQFKNESLDLFKSKVEHISEATLIEEMVAILQSSQLHLVDIQIKMLFNKFETINHESQDWHHNLRTLLAHGFDVVNSSTDFKLAKSYSPFKFSLYVEKTKGHVHFGSFYKEATQGVPEQFIKFCKVTEYPPGINEHTILEVLMNDGGSLIAVGDGVTTVLAKRDPLTDTITGSDEVLRFLSKPTKRQSG